MFWRSDGHDVAVTGIGPRLDQSNKKANEVNSCLVPICNERDTSFIPSCLLHSFFHADIDDINQVLENMESRM